MIENGLMPSGISIIDVTKAIKYEYEFFKKFPNFFRPCGLLCFYGPQGSGKTLTAVQYVRETMRQYPKVKLCTNVEIKEFPIGMKDKDGNQRVYFFKNSNDLLKYKNGINGVIYLIDEIHLYFNSLQSKSISIEVINLISQQRKQRIHIVATSQIFSRMAKPLREQFSEVIECQCFFRKLQINHLIKRDVNEDTDDMGKPKRKFSKTYIFVHTVDMYESYDTYVVIEKDKDRLRTIKTELVYE